MPSISISVSSDSIRYVKWVFVSGQTRLEDTTQGGGTISVQGNASAKLTITNVTTKNGYHAPIIFDRTQPWAYKQTIVNADGAFEDADINCNVDKVGTLYATAYYTVKIKPSTSVPSFSWSMSDGGSGTWSLENDGPEASWTRAEGTELTITSCAPSSSYKHPVYYERTDQSQQQITNSDGTWKDRIISFTVNKTGTLVATYVKPAVTYTLHYDGNGATSGSMSDQTGNDSYYVKGNEFVRTGYVFRYWSDFNGHTYSPDQIIHLTADTTLHAIWAKEYYDIIFNDNGGTGGPNRQTKHIDEDLIISYTEPTRAGYVFMGWAWSSSADEADYLPGDIYETNAGTVLYAVWKTAHTVTFYYSELIEVYTAYDGEIITLEELEDTATQRFVGWHYVQGGAYYEVLGGTDVIIDEDIDFYSDWITITYTITYNGNNATSGSTAKQEGSSTYTIRQNGFQRTGYAFQYWTYSDEYDQEHIYRPGDRVTPQRNMTLYAFWLRAYDVTYNANGGTGAPSTQTKTHGVDLTLSSTVPTRSGYDFVNWYDGTDYYSPGGLYTANSPASLYAQWRLKTYTVTYNLNGGQGGPASPDTKTHGVAYTIPSTKPTKEGNSFQHWVDDLENSYDPGASYVRNANTIFSAVWKLNEYDVTYYANGGSGAPAKQKKVYGVDLTLSTVKPTKADSVFLGWAKSSAATTAQYQPGDTYTDDKTLYLWAVWTAKTKFYWHGSDSADAQYFKAGERIDLAVTASAWNSLCGYINDVRRLAGMSTKTFTTVTAGQPIRASIYKEVRDAIYEIVLAGYGRHVPSEVSAGTEITTALFNGADGLKAAINSCMDDL